MAEPKNSTPSTLRQFRSQVFDLAFRTPPRRSRTETSASEMKISSATKLLSPARAASTPPERTNGNKDSRKITNSRLAGLELDRKRLRMSLSKKKSQYYDQAFAFREVNYNVNSRAAKDSLIMAEVKISGCLEPQYDFLIDFAFLLSEIYQRPAGCIMISISTDCSIMLDGSSEPAYRIDITALEAEIAATKNKRTAGLVQNFMLENVQIPAARGVLAFKTIKEENIIAVGVEGLHNTSRSGTENTNDYSLSKSVTGNSNRRSRKSSAARTAVCVNDVTAISYVNPTSPPGLESFVNTGIGNAEGQSRKKGVKKRKSLMALLGF